ncbi:MAG: histidinol-phosphate transaminase [Firmicutes bacterium]|nr:histidinol-phosphate transaminase [Bacillota bacterium]
MNEQKYWSRAARAAVPYVPGEQPKDRSFIKLNTNENPYGPSPKLKEIDPFSLRFELYPEPTALMLRQAIAKANDLSLDEVFVGNGSDEVLAFAFSAFADEDDPVSFPDITYSFYPVWSEYFGAPKQIFPLGKDLSIDLSMVPDGFGPVVIANPNAPTGVALAREVLEDYLKAHPERLMIVDEAYVDFGAESIVPLIHSYPNLLVVQTFSKSRALAGLRLGFAMGQKSLIDAIIRIKDSINSYTVNTWSQVAGTISYQDKEYTGEIVQKIIRTRECTKEKLRDLGFEVGDSKANFLWVKHPEFSGTKLYEYLRGEGILVRHFSSPAITDYLRISVGTDEEMDQLVTTLSKLFGGDKS